MWATTAGGGPKFDGTIFELSSGGTVKTLYNFSGTDGAYPAAALVETVYGTYLGSTETGGSSNLGTLSEITGAGTLTTIHTFQGTEGEFPVAPLVPGPSGRFYSVNEYGTNNINGDILSITANGSNFKLVHRFPIGKTAAVKPVQLLLGSDGNFYGIMARGGANNAGTIFQMTPTGTVTILHDFS